MTSGEKLLYAQALLKTAYARDVRVHVTNISPCLLKFASKTLDLRRVAELKAMFDPGQQLGNVILVIDNDEEEVAAWLMNNRDGLSEKNLKKPYQYKDKPLKLYAIAGQHYSSMAATQIYDANPADDKP
jgi:hypothetical protein